MTSQIGRGTPARRERLSPLALATALALLPAQPAQAETPRPITTLELKLLGVSATLDPASPVVPKNTPAGVRVVVRAGGQALSAGDVERFLGGAFQLRAELSGPGLSQTISLPFADEEGPESLIPPNPLILPLPPLPTAGDYRLSNVRFEVAGIPALDVEPRNALLEVIDQVLVTSVKTRPLTLDEIKARGIILDRDDYIGFEFTMGLMLESELINFAFPVVFDRDNVPIPLPITAPPPPFRGSVNLPFFAPMLLQLEEPGAPGEEPAQPPRLPNGDPVRIPSVLVIPGNIGLLKQFFSAQLYVSNGAPAGSGLAIHTITGKVDLPEGDDGVPGSDDDPLALPTLLRDGVQVVQPETLPVLSPGPDGTPQTGDDGGSLRPGEQGQAEFVLRGELEGFHTLSFDVRAVLEGLATGPVTLLGSANGGVLVRNGKLDVTFILPSVVRDGEPFPMFVTVTNIGQGIANDVSVMLDAGRMSGARLPDGAEDTLSIATLQPGESDTLEFTFEAGRTGQVVASYLRFDTVDGSTGTIDFTLSVDERGVPLSPDTLALPASLGALPSSVVRPAMRTLGQGWSVANAPANTLPEGVVRTTTRVVTLKALALAEAGLRVGLGQGLNAALRDLVCDFYGGDPLDPGFDQLLRETGAGHGFSAAIGAALRDADLGGDALAAAGGLLPYERALAQVAASGPDFVSIAVGRAGGAAPVEVVLRDGDGRRTPALQASGELEAGVRGAVWLSLGPPGDAPLLGLITAPDSSPYAVELRGLAAGAVDIAVTLPAGDGTFIGGRITGAEVRSTSRARLVLDLSAPDVLVLEQDLDGNGAFEASQALASVPIVSQGPEPLSAAVIGPETLDGAGPFGVNLAILFDRVVDEASAGDDQAYSIPRNAVIGALRQLSGRFVFAALEQPEGPYVGTTLTARGVADPRGAVGPARTVDLDVKLEDPGAVVLGRVFTAEGTPVGGAVVTYENNPAWASCGAARPAGIAAVPTDAAGRYEFRYVRQDNCGRNFGVKVRDPDSGSLRSAFDSVRVPNERIVLDFALFGRGDVAGVVRNLAGQPVPGARVVVRSETDPQVGGQTTTDGAGRFTVFGITVGNFTVTAGLGPSLGRTSGNIGRAGATANVVVTLDGDAARVSGRVLKVQGGDSTPVPGVTAFYRFVPDEPQLPAVTVGVVQSGSDGGFAFDGVPVGGFRIEASLNTRDRGSTSGSVAAGDDLTGQDVLIAIEDDSGFGSASGVVRLPGEAGGFPGAIVSVNGRGVLTEADGGFVLPGIPVRPGQAQLLTAQTPDGKRSASTRIIVDDPGEVIDGIELTLSGLATAVFKVFDADGNELSGQPVAIFGSCTNPCGCLTRTTDGAGEAIFSGLSLGTVNARAIRSSGGFVDVVDGTVRLTQDGQSVLGVMRFAGSGSVSGTVLEPDDDPAFGADLTLWSNSYDFDTCTLRFARSHTARTGTDGTFAMSSVGVGRVNVTASQPFFDTPVGESGVISEAGANLDFTLRLVDTTAGKLFGKVLLPDGLTPAGPGIEVTAAGALPDVIVETRADSSFEFAEILPQGSYQVTVRDPVTGGVARERIFLRAGEDVEHDLRLLGRGQVSVRVVDGADQEVDDAFVTLRELGFPNGVLEDALEPATGGVATFPNVFEGRFSVEATDPFARGGRATGVLPGPGAAVEVKVRLTVTGTVTGRFTMPAGTPIPFAVVKLLSNGRAIGQTTTAGTGPADQVGRFSFDFVPAGSIEVRAEDPLTARAGLALGTIESDGEVLDLSVVAQGLGRVEGVVTENGALRSGAHVDIRSGEYGACTTTDSQGGYFIDGVPEGRVVATASLSGGFLAGTASGTLSGDGSTLPLDVALRASGAVTGTVTAATGGPAPPSIVTLRVGGLGGATLDEVTDEDGAFHFLRVPAGLASASVEVLGSLDRAGGPVDVVGGQVADVTFRLQGVGSISGTTLDSGGAPVAGRVTFSGDSFPLSLTLVTGNEGSFRVPEALAGAFTARLKAEVGGFTLFGTSSGEVLPDRETSIAVQTEPSGSVIGVIVRSDGSAAFGAAVTVDLGPGQPKVSRQARSDGAFLIEGVPLASFTLRAADPVTAGLAVVPGLELTTNGQVLDLGEVTLDDQPPVLTFVQPSDGQTKGPFGGPIELRLEDLVTGVDEATLQVIYPSGPPQTTGFAFDAGTATGALRSSSLSAGENRLVARVADRAGNLGEAEISFTVLGGTVRGTVRSAAGSVAVGVPVQVDSLTPLVTDDLGHYAQPGLRPGTHFATATDPGTGLSATRGDTLIDGGELVLDLQLPAFGSIAGIVTHPSGAAAEGVTVSAGLRADVTGNDGSYLLPGLPLGSYVVDATDPSNGDRGQAAVSILSLGQRATASIALNGVGSVTVTVKDAGGALVEGAGVSLSSSSPFAGIGTATTGPNGQAAFPHVLAGTITARATSPQGLEGSAEGALDDGGSLPLTVELEPAGRVEGTVRTFEAAPVPGVDVALSGPKDATTTTGADGGYGFDFVPLGDFTVTATNPADGDKGRTTGLLLASGQTATADIDLVGVSTLSVHVITSLGDDVAGASVTVSQNPEFPKSFSGVTGSDGRVTFDGVLAGPATVTAVSGSVRGTTEEAVTPGPFEVTVELEPVASIAGRVLRADGATPLEGVTVTAGASSTTSETDGSYRLDELTLGSYFVVARIDGRARAAPIRVELTQSEQVFEQDVVLVGFGAVAGQITDPAGAPADGAEIQLQQTGSFGGFFGAVTDGDGRYSIDGVVVGELTLAAIREPLGERIDAIGFLESDGDTLTLDLQLVSDAATLPVRLSDGNALQWNVQENGGLIHGFMFGSGVGGTPTFRVVVDGATHVLAGSGATATTEENAREIVVEEELAGLRVTRKVFVPTDGYFIRYLTLLENPGPEAISFDAIEHSDYSASDVVASASGDGELTAADSWVVLDDGDTKNVYRAPNIQFAFAPIASVAAGPGGVPPDAAEFEPTADVVSYRWSGLVVPPGGKIALLHLLSAQSLRDRAVAAAERLVQLPPEILAGLSPEEAQAVVNFVVPVDLVSDLEPLPPLDGVVAGRVLAGDRETPADIRFAGDEVVFESRTPFYGRLFFPNPDPDGTFRLIGDPRDPSQATLIPRDAFQLQADYFTSFGRQQTPIVVGAFPDSGTIDLTRLAGGRVTASSEWPPRPVANAVDANPATYWTADVGNAASPPHNDVDSPWIEIGFPGEAMVDEVRVRGRRGSDANAILTARLEVRDGGDAVVWSTELDLPLPDRDADVPVPGIVGRAVRLVSLADKSSTPGLSELQVLGRAALGPAGRVDVDLVFTGTGVLAGQVLQFDGQPLGGGSVVLSDGAGSDSRRPDSSDGGFVFILLPPDSYTLRATHPLGGAFTEVIGLEIPADRRTVQNLVYAEFGSLRGHKRSFDGIALGGVVALEAPGFRRTLNAAATTGYNFVDVPPGSYTLSASDTASGAEVAEPVEIVAAVETQQDVVLPPIGVLRVTARVAGAPLRGATIRWESSSRPTRATAPGTTDDGGLLVVANVPGTDVTVIAEHPGTGGRSFGTATASLTAQGQQLDVTVDVPGVGEVAGTLRGLDGAAHDGEVAVVDATEEDEIASFAAAADGVFAFDDVPVGAFRLRGEKLVAYAGVWTRSMAERDARIDSHGQMLAVDALVPIGTIAEPGQLDAWQLLLSVGQPSTIYLTGFDSASTPLDDPLLQVFGPDGALAAENDDRSVFSKDSRVQFTAPSAGRYTFIARAAGEQVGGYRLGSTGSGPEFVFRPYDGPAVAGTVSVESGAPLAGLRVRVSRGGAELSTRTAADGSYQVPLVVPGPFTLDVIDAGGVVIFTTSGEVLGGEDAAVDPTIPARGSVDATVRRGSDAIPGLAVTLESDHPAALAADRIRVGTTDPAGLVATELPVGSVTARAVDPQSGIEFQASGLLSEGATLDLTIELPALITTIFGVVANQSGTLLPGATVELAGLAARTTDAGGAYRFEGVPAGNHELVARFGTASETAPVTASGGTLEQNFALNVQILQGGVKEADGSATTAGIEACGLDQGFATVCVSTATDAGGSYRFVGLPDWRANRTVIVTATADDGSELTTSEGFLFSGTFGDPITVDLTFPPTGELSGEVFDASGGEVVGASVVVYGGSTQLGSTVTDAAGYRFPRVPVGAVSVFAEDTDTIPGTGSGEIVEDGTTTVDVTLAEVGTLDISLSDPTRDPVDGGVTVTAFDSPRRSPFASSWERTVELSAGGVPATVAVRVPAGFFQAVHGGPEPSAVEGDVAAGQRLRIALRQGSHVDAPVVIAGDRADYSDEPFSCADPCFAFVETSSGEGLFLPPQLQPWLDGQAYRSLTVLGDDGELRLRRQLFVPVSGAFARAVTFVENPTTQEKSQFFTSRAGAGGAFFSLVATGSGDAGFDETDAWLLATAASGEGFGVVLGDAVAAESASFFGGVFASAQAEHELIVPAGETRAFMTFTFRRTDLSEPDMIALASALADLSEPAALVGLSQAERDQIANFAVPLPGLRITGTVSAANALPVAGAKVQLLDEASAAVVAEARSDALGGFDLVGFRPGAYALLALDPVTNRAGRAAVSIASGETLDVPVTLMSEGELGTVDVAGLRQALEEEPAAGERVELISTPLHPIWSVFEDLDGAGQASVPEVPAGIVEVRRPGDAPDVGWVDGELAAGGTLSVRLEIGDREWLPADLTGGDGLVYLAHTAGEVHGSDSRCRPFCGPFAEVGGEAYRERFAGQILQGGREIDTGPRALSGLVVNRRQFVPAGGGFARVLDVVHNPTAGAIGVDYTLSLALASALGTWDLLATSSGDLVFDGVDHYAALRPSGGEWPDVALVTSGPGAPRSFDTFSWDGTDASAPAYLATWTGLTVAPGETLVLMTFIAQGGAIVEVDVVDVAESLIALTHPDALLGMSAAERAAVANFQVP